MGALTWADYSRNSVSSARPALTIDPAARRDTTLSKAGDEEVHTQVTTKQVKQLDRVIIRFAGDSGDGMQLTGDRFTQESAAFGNDLSTLPNFPAEIRAPQGTLPGVS